MSMNQKLLDELREHYAKHGGERMDWDTSCWFVDTMNAMHPTLTFLAEKDSEGNPLIYVDDGLFGSYL